MQIELGQQGSVQFAFGRNDVPEIPTEARLEPSQKPTATRNTVELSSSSEYEENESIEVKQHCENIPSSQKELANIISEENDERDRNFQTEDLFSQRQQELESSVYVPHLDFDNSHDCFEDSLPEIVVANLSSLYPKPQESPDHDSMNSSRLKYLPISPIVEMENALPTNDTRTELKTSAGFSETPRSVQGLLQSTPMTSVRNEMIRSNGFANSHPKDGLLPEISNEKGEASSKTNQPQMLHEISAGLMAEFDNDFDSGEVNDLGDGAGPNLPCSHPENFSFDEEDFILTQGPVVTEEDDIEDELEVLGESSSEAEDSSTYTEGSSIQSAGHNNPLYEAIVGKQKLTVRVIQSVELVPASFFSESEMIGVGLKLVPQKKGSSIARQGIGARILGKVASTNNMEEDQKHSLAIFNGNGTIWVLRWSTDDHLKVGRSNVENGCTRESRLVQLLSKLQSCKSSLVIFECKEKLKTLLKQCGTDLLSKLPPGNRIWDPKIAQWIWDFDDEDWNISKSKLINTYVEEEDKAILNLRWDKEVVESFTAWKVMSKLKDQLRKANLWTHFTETEMSSIIPLLLMELNGFGLDSMQLGKLKRVLQFQSALLELRAYKLAGRQFNIKSPKDVKQVLYREIGLKQPKAAGTGKDVLLKLDHELPRVIVESRKVDSALQKIVIPFQQERNLDTGRVHGHYSHFTVTGRVVMSEPSLQCIPRDFDIPISYDEKEIHELKQNSRIKYGSKLNALLQQIDNELMDPSFLDDVNVISMRNVFVPSSGDFTILTADYSQLELRILAHLSQDLNLVQALNADTDVFIEIASEWKKLPKERITSAIRQEAKGIIYGVIYGMGTKALSEQMEIDEREAAKFIGQFMRAYPGVKRFLDHAISSCSEKEYVETMTGRRRYLPLINSRVSHEKAKAGRQATNSQIQGSAADLVKSAMTRIHAYLSSHFPKSCIPIEWNKIAKARRSSLSVGSYKTQTQLEDLICFPILNLHDELIFEVRKTYLPEIAKIIKREMECCVKLRVKLPVVIKTGDTWGTLEPYEINS